MLLLCRIAFAVAREEAKSGGITGGMEGPEQRREGQNEKGTGKGERERERRLPRAGEVRRAGGTRSGVGEAKRVVESAGGEAKSMHRGGMQRTLRARRAKQYGPMSESAFSTALYDRSLSLLLPLPSPDRGRRVRVRTRRYYFFGPVESVDPRELVRGSKRADARILKPREIEGKSLGNGSLFLRQSQRRGVGLFVCLCSAERWVSLLM